MPSTEAVSGASIAAQGRVEKRARKSGKVAEGKTESKHAVEEIQAYIVIRDGLLAEAEKKATSELLRRLSIANDLVENCLRPARSPYEAQSFPETDAARERQRCETVRKRVAQLGPQGTRQL